jgi:hypothetical protein
MKPTCFHTGYVFLVGVLVIGAIAAATTMSLLLLGWAAEQNGRTIEESARAVEIARACAERTLRTLRSNLAYAGNETLSLYGGQCVIRPINGSGNEQRIVCIEGRYGVVYRRL